MTNSFIKPLLALTLITISVNLFAQDDNFEQLSKTPKDTTIHFPIDYKIARPRLEYPNWGKDFEAYNNSLTPAIRKTQMSLSSSQNGIGTTITPNSITPHAQLDTLTVVDNAQKIMGTWRMVQVRSIRFNDSVSLVAKACYRLADTLLEDKSRDEVFAVFTDDVFKLYAKEVGKQRFKKMMSARYKIEGKRFMMVYKLIKASGGVSQFGIDEKGYLIINYPQVIEKTKPYEYFSSYAIIEQYIFEKVK